MNRKQIRLRNIGTRTVEASTYVGTPGQAHRTAIAMPERTLLDLLRREVDRFALATGLADLRAFMGWIFDPTTGEDEREEFVLNFQRKPPTVVQGYPRRTADFPAIAVVLSEENETDNVLGDYLGHAQDGETGDFAEYYGSGWDLGYHVYVYAEHPTQCAYLYQMAKLILLGGKSTIEGCGFKSLSFSGGELQPEEQYAPENMFVRVLRVTGKATFSIPLFKRDPARYTVGVYQSDVVVEGLRGGLAAVICPDGEVSG